MWCDWEWKWMTPAPTPPPAVSKRKGAVVRVSSWEHWCGGECLWTLAPGPSLALPVLGLGFPCVRARLVPLGGPGLLLAREFLRPRPGVVHSFRGPGFLSRKDGPCTTGERK